MEEFEIKKEFNGSSFWKVDSIENDNDEFINDFINNNDNE